MAMPAESVRLGMRTQPPRIELHHGWGWLTAETSLVKFRNRNDANGYYKALDLQPDASKEEIRARFRTLAKKLHPDVGGDEDLFRFVVEIANTLLDDESKVAYDSTSGDSIYIGVIEREELMREASARGPITRTSVPEVVERKEHWDFCAVGEADPDVASRWVELCREASPAVGYRGRIRICFIDTDQPWEVIEPDLMIPLIGIKKGLEPNRLYALCAMIMWQEYCVRQTIRPKRDG